MIQNFIPITIGELPCEFLGHDSVAHFDLEAGAEGSCLEAADRSIIYRFTTNEFDRAFTPWLANFSGIPRAVDSDKTKKAQARSKQPDKISPVYETFSTFQRRVLVKMTDDQIKEIKAEALRLSRSIAVNAKPESRISPIEQMYYKRADSLLDQELDLINSRVSNYIALVPHFELARDSHDRPERESLARLLQQYEAARWAMED